MVGPRHKPNANDRHHDQHCFQIKLEWPLFLSVHFELIHTTSLPNAIRYRGQNWRIATRLDRSILVRLCRTETRNTQIEIESYAILC